MSIVAGFIEVYDLLGGFGGDDSGLGIRFGFLDLAFGEGYAKGLSGKHDGKIWTAVSSRRLQRFVRCDKV